MIHGRKSSRTVHRRRVARGLEHHTTKRYSPFLGRLRGGCLQLPDRPTRMPELCLSLGDSKAMLCHGTEDLERYFKGTGVLFSITAVAAAILMPYLGKSGQCTISSLTKFAILDHVK